MISKLRKQSERIAFVLASPFVACRVPPLLVSLLALPFAFLFVFFVWNSNLIAAFFFGLAAVLVVLVDGETARRLNKASLFGNYVEGTIDKAVDFIIIGAFVPLFPIATVLALGSSFLVSFAKPRVALVIVTDNRHWPGIGERGDKLALLLAGTLLAAFISNAFGFPVLEIALLLVAAIALIGMFQRVLYGKKLIEEAKRAGGVLPYLRAKNWER